MNRIDQSQRIEALFHQAIERPAAQRDAFLRAACGDDQDLYNAVQPLVAAIDETGDFLEHPEPGLPSTALPKDRLDAIRDDADDWVGRRVGKWRLTQRIATGGMGTVFLGERADGQYEQRAAIKVMNRSLLADEPSRRRKLFRQFQDEQQHLANLHHENIARLLDAGTTSEGLPFLVMELIDGEPVTAYCHARQLSLEDRLRLFIKVCFAVEYLHHSFIAHRDLKPSNIFVTESPEQNGQPIPKLLDFGIAKFWKKDLDEPAATTEGVLHPMTLQYASPEQVSNRPITATSDVYSLGVVLFELVTGELPYEVSTYDARRIISEQPPKRPRAIRPNLDRDVENIILRAIEKDAHARYESAASLAIDIQCFLDGKPIVAHPPSALYRFGKLISRHRWNLVAAAVVLLVGAIVGVAVYDVSRRAAETQKNQERWIQANRLLIVGRALVNKGIYAEAEIALRAALEIKTEIESELSDESHQGSLWLTAESQGYLGVSLAGLERYNEARSLLEGSYEVLRDQLGDDHRRTAFIRGWLIRVYDAIGMNKQADELRAIDERLAAPNGSS